MTVTDSHPIEVGDAALNGLVGRLRGSSSGPATADTTTTDHSGTA